MRRLVLGGIFEDRCLSALQALALMAAFKDEWPCLIIVPSSLRGDSLLCVSTPLHAPVLCPLLLT